MIASNSRRRWCLEFVLPWLDNINLSKKVRGEERERRGEEWSGVERRGEERRGEERRGEETDERVYNLVRVRNHRLCESCKKRNYLPLICERFLLFLCYVFIRTTLCGILHIKLYWKQFISTLPSMCCRYDLLCYIILRSLLLHVLSVCCRDLLLNSNKEYVSQSGLFVSIHVWEPILERYQSSA